MTLRFLHLSFRSILMTLSVLVLLWLIGKDLGISGRLEMVYDFSHDSPFIQRLWPPGRASLIEWENGDAVQRMQIDPILVDVQLPRQYRDVTFEIVYKKPEEQMFRVGIRAAPKVWAWEIRSLDVEPDERPGWQRARVHFENIDRFDTNDGRLHFLLNAPGLFESGRSITLTEIRVVATKEPLHWWDTLPRSLGFLKRLF